MLTIVSRRFAANQRGSVAIIFAISMVGLFGIAGLALDYNQWSRAKQKLQQTADEVTLAAARKATDLTTQGMTPAEAEAGALEMANALWNSNISKISAQVDTPIIALKNTSGDTWTATLTYNAKMTTSLSSAIGIKSLDVNGKAVANLAMAMAYMDITFLLDTSQSMGLAANKSGADQLTALTGCMFGCHVAGESANYDAAKANGIPMRIDVLRAATSKIIAEAIKTAEAPDQYQIGLYTFDRSVTELSAPSTNLSSQQSAVSMIDLPTYTDGTQFDDALTELNNKITTSGNGSSPSSRRKFAFIVTDGVQNGIYTGWYPPSDQPGVPSWKVSTINPASCDALKSKGVTVAVLYTTYVQFPGWWQYDDIIAPFINDIAPKLEACASPDFFFQATSADDINVKMMKMFTKSVEAAKGLRLTN